MIKLRNSGSTKEVIFRPTPNHCRLYTRAIVRNPGTKYGFGAYNYYPDSVAKARTIGPNEVSYWDDA